MKPTTDDVLKWARDAGFNPISFMGGNLTLKTKFAAIAYAAGAADMKERCAKVAEFVLKMPKNDVSTYIRSLGDDE